MAGLGIVSAIPGYRANGCVLGNLGKEVRQHRRITRPIAGDIDGPDFLGFGVNPQVHLTPLPAVVGAMLLGFPLTLTEHFDARAIHQQMQYIVLAAMGDDSLQVLLAPRARAEIRNRPIQP